MATHKEKSNRVDTRKLPLPVRFFGTAALTTAAVFGSGCIEINETPQETERAKGSIQGIDKNKQNRDTELDQPDLKPFWLYEDLAFSRYSSEQIATYKVQVFQRPDFYKGKMPLVFYNYQVPGFGFGSLEVNIMDEHDEFVNMYAVDGLSTIGVQTFKYEVNDQGPFLRTVLAEAVREKPSGGENNAIVFREYHYDDDGNIIFEALSEFDSLGNKIDENVISGNKEKDYYFLIQVF